MVKRPKLDVGLKRDAGVLPPSTALDATIGLFSVSIRRARVGTCDGNTMRKLTATSNFNDLIIPIAWTSHCYVQLRFLGH